MSDIWGNFNNQLSQNDLWNFYGATSIPGFLLQSGAGIGNPNGPLDIGTVGQNYQNAFFGGTEQLGSDYTAQQQGLADTAYGNAAGAITGFRPNAQLSSQYANYLNTVSPGNLFSQAVDPTQYQGFVDASLSQAGQALQAQAQQQGEQAAMQAANQYNLQGPGGLYSGAAARAVAEGAAAPQYAANVQFANMRSNLMNQLLGQNLGSMGTELGLQAQGQGNLFQGELSQNQLANQLGLQQALGLAGIYGQQAGGYDTGAMFSDTPGLFDWTSNIADIYATVQATQ